MRSIRFRLTLGLLLGSGVLLAAGLLVLWLQISRRVLADFDGNLLAEGRALTSLVAVNGGDVRLDYADEAMPQFSSPNESSYFEVRRKDGTLVERSASLHDATLGPLTMPPEPVRFDALVMPNGEHARRVTLLTSPLQRESDESKGEPEQEDTVHPAAATVYVAVAHGTAHIDAFLDRLRWGILAWGALMLLGAWAVVLATLGWSLAPLDRVSREVEQLNADSLDTVLGAETLPAELQPMVRQINDLLQRLEHAFRRESDFSANVAHELRTPLAELRSLSDVALAYPGDGKAQQDFFADSRAVGLHMERLVDSLLALAHAESGYATPAAERVELRAAVEHGWQPVAGLARQRGLELRLRVDESAAVLTDRRGLELILANLLSNAASHAAPHGWVEVAVDGVASAVGTGDLRLLISNPAPDLEPADVPRLFERFWRKSAAREPTGHLGLGLPLAATLAANLGISLRPSLSADHVLALELRLASANVG